MKGVGGVDGGCFSSDSSFHPLLYALLRSRQLNKMDRQDVSGPGWFDRPQKV